MKNLSSAAVWSVNPKGKRLASEIYLGSKGGKAGKR